MDSLYIRKQKKVGEVSVFTDFILNLLFIVFALICIVPIIFVIIISLTNEKELLMTGYTFFPKELSFKAYSYVIAAGDVIWRAYGISIFC